MNDSFLNHANFAASTVNPANRVEGPWRRDPFHGSVRASSSCCRQNLFVDVTSRDWTLWQGDPCWLRHRGLATAAGRTLGSVPCSDFFSEVGFFFCLQESHARFEVLHTGKCWTSGTKSSGWLLVDLIRAILPVGLVQVTQVYRCLSTVGKFELAHSKNLGEGIATRF